MSITKLHYSDTTDNIYLDENKATMSECNAKRAKLVSEFDKLRKEYNQEHRKLRGRYQDKFDSILEAISILEHEQLQK